jgi:hypothetical protein
MLRSLWASSHADCELSSKQITDITDNTSKKLVLKICESLIQGKESFTKTVTNMIENKVNEVVNATNLDFNDRLTHLFLENLSTHLSKIRGSSQMLYSMAYRSPHGNSVFVGLIRDINNDAIKNIRESNMIKILFI